MRALRFVKYYDKGSTGYAADQIAEALAARGVDARSIYAHEAARERGALLVFIKTSKLHHLLAARLRGSLALLDVHDTLVFKRRLKNAALFAGAIFRSRRAAADFDRPGWRSLVLWHQGDPRYRPHEVPAGEFRAVYLGERRSLRLFGELAGVDCVESDWFARAPAYNCHLSVREPGREYLYKPGAKVSTAAACRAVLVTTRDQTALEMLGPDYPFYCEPDRDSIAAALARARRGLDGEEWRRALAVLEGVRERTRLDRILDESLAYFGGFAPPGPAI